MRCAVALLAAGLVAQAAACGPSRGLPPTVTASPAASARPSGAASDPDGWTSAVTMARDGNLLVTVTVTGPLTVEGGCVASLTAWAVTAAGAVLPTPSPSGLQVHCLAIALIEVPAGATRAFTAEIPPPAQPGTYSIDGTLRTLSGSNTSIPVVTLIV